MLHIVPESVSLQLYGRSFPHSSPHALGKRFKANYYSLGPMLLPVLVLMGFATLVLVWGPTPSDVRTYI